MLKPLDEIPPFAHRLPSPDAELDPRITMMPGMAWKPVIHLTTDVPLAVDIRVDLSGGCPWIAYPLFDDLTLVRKNHAGGDRAGSMVNIDPPKSRNPLPLEKLHAGYPWLLPNRQTYSWIRPGESIFWGPNRALVPPGGGRKLAESVGLHWQSVIVSPTRLPWMTLAEVGSDARFAWWKRLREVDCSWVSSRGESERFLYYDGPVDQLAPVRVEVAGGQLRLIRQTAPDRHRAGVYVVVTQNEVTMQWDRWGMTADVSHLPAKAPIAAEDEFARILQQEGLNRTEAEGLVSCWREAFFRTPGRRFLCLMSPLDYDDLCPLTIRPTPAERVRVGILWTEFSADDQEMRPSDSLDVPAG